MVTYTIVDNFDNEATIDASEKTKLVEYNGRKFKIVSKDPYGYWYVSLEKGSTPKELDQSFTTLSAAMKKCEIYANNNPPKLTYHQALDLEGDTLDPNRKSIFDGDSKKGPKGPLGPRKSKKNAEASGN